jgi:hypothetical protein
MVGRAWVIGQVTAGTAVRSLCPAMPTLDEVPPFSPLVRGGI